jgi:Short C-terminal domain
LVGGGAIVAAQLRDSQRWPLVALLAGVAGGGVAWYDRNNLQDKADDIDLAVVQVGWGLNLALAASVSLVIAAGVVGERRRHRHLVAAGKAAPPVPRSPSSSPTSMSPAQPPQTVESPPERASPSPGSVNELERLAALHASGALTDDEFQAAKRGLLGDTGDSAARQE